MNAAVPYQYSSSPGRQYPSSPVRRISKLGIASFLIALGFPFLLLLLVAILAVLSILQEHGHGPFFDNQVGDEILLVLIAFGGLGGPLVHFVGLGIGIGGAFQRERKRLFGILGIVLNGILLLLLAISWMVFFSWLMKALAWH